MKTLILAFSASILLPAFASAGDNVVPLEKLSKNSNLYRIVPRGTMIPNNRGGSNSNSGGSSGYSSYARGTNVYFKPTQHYYTQDATISYRYTAERGGAGHNTYLGPNASYYNPHREGLSPNVAIRSLAHVEPSRQPGVPMRANRWREANIENFDGDTFYRRAESQRLYNGGDVEPTTGATSRIERAER